MPNKRKRQHSPKAAASKTRNRNSGSASEAAAASAVKTNKKKKEEEEGSSDDINNDNTTTGNKNPFLVHFGGDDEDVNNNNNNDSSSNLIELVLKFLELTKKQQQKQPKKPSSSFSAGDDDDGGGGEGYPDDDDKSFIINRSLDMVVEDILKFMENDSSDDGRDVENTTADDDTNNNESNKNEHNPHHPHPSNKSNNKKRICDDNDDDNSGGDGGSVISNTNLVSLLLPWAVKRILYRHQHDGGQYVPWKCLEACLTTLSSSKTERKKKDNSAVALKTILTTSVLHKLVPLALQVGTNCDDDDYEITAANKVTTAAKCYCIMVDRLYRPPFETICDTLLPLFTKCIMSSSEMLSGLPLSQYGTEEMLRPLHPMILLSTLELFHSVMIKRSNPKKSFQQLINQKVFASLSNIYHFCVSWKYDSCVQLIHNIIQDGIFHIEHHLDGFRSIQYDIIPNLDDAIDKTIAAAETPTTKSDHKIIKCYQEGLFSMIDRCIDDLVDNDNTNDINNNITMIKAIPLLLDGFVRQSTILQEQLRTKSGGRQNKASYKISQIQFGFFTRVTFPLLKFLKQQQNTTSLRSTKTREEILDSIGKNLDIILNNDVYHPTNNEQSEKDFASLTFLTNIILESLTTMDPPGDTGLQKEWKKILCILTTLTRLNHLLLHDHVPTIIANCLTYSADSTDDSLPQLVPETQNLLVTLIDTYQKLRQLDYVFRSFTRLADMLHGDNTDSSKEKIFNFNQLHNNPATRESIAKAVRDIPLDQLRKIISEMNEWIEEASHLYFNNNTVDAWALAKFLILSAVVRLFSVVIQNVRVDMATAHETYTSCNDILNVAVHGLLGDGNLDNRSSAFILVCIKDALLLCTWSIDLKNRCDFWIRNSREKTASIETITTIPQPVIDLINNAMDDVSGGEGVSLYSKNMSKAYYVELQFLACYRIHQLHTDIHEKQRIAFVTDSPEYDCSRDIADAARLAKFALALMKDEDCRESVTRMGFLAKHVASWAPYAESQDMHSFLYDSILHIAAKHSTTVVIDAHLRQEGDSLSSVFHDAGFYEIDGVSERICLAALSCVAGFVHQGLLKLSFSREDFSGLLDFPRPNTRVINIGGALTHPTNGKLRNMFEKNIALPITHANAERRESASRLFKAALHCLMILNGMPKTVWSASVDKRAMLDSTLTLEKVLCDSIIEERYSDVYQDVLDLVSALRFTSSILLCGLKGEPDTVEFVDGNIIECMVALLFSSTPRLMKRVECDSARQQKLLKASQRLLRASVEYCSHNLDCIGGLDAAIRASLVRLSEFDDTEKLVAFSFGHCLLNSFGKGSALAASNGITDESAGQRQPISSLLKAMKKDAFKYAFSDNAGDVSLHEMALLLVAEMFRGGTDGHISAEEKRLFESEIIKHSKQILIEKSIPSEKLSTASYLIACLAMSSPSPKTRSTLALQILISGARSNGVLESSVCKLIEGLSAKEMEEILEVLVTDDDAKSCDSYVSRIRFFRFMILTLTSPSQVEVLAKFSRRFLFLSLRILQSITSECDDSVPCAIELIIDMFRSKDIITTSERDIAMILCHLNTALNNSSSSLRRSSTPGRGDKDDGFTPAPAGVFDAAFLMLSFLLQRFSKQLHHCVPSVTSTLTVILQHCLYGGEQVDDIEIKKRGQKFTRLCELLMNHKDVYKKHILCLLVEFVQALRGDMDTVRKNCLSPAIYCLLDILQQHETAQLNTMLDDMGRALFRSLHENYKKVHVYKGQ